MTGVLTGKASILSKFSELSSPPTFDRSEPVLLRRMLPILKSSVLDENTLLDPRAGEGGMGRGEGKPSVELEEPLLCDL